MNFATADPGMSTGLAIWSAEITNSQHPPRWELLHIGTVKYACAREYIDRLEACRKHYNIWFAVIERWVNYGRRFANSEKMVTQQTLLSEVWPQHILIPKKVWDPANMQPGYQRAYALEYGLDTVNEHELDAVCMGLNLFRRLPVDHEDKAAYLWTRAIDHKTVGKLM